MTNWLTLLRARVLRALLPPPAHDGAAREGAINAPPADAPIDDGVNYTLPVLMPAYLEEALIRANKYNAYLLEATRDTYRFQFDTPQRGAADLPIPVFVDDPLRELPWATRRFLLSHTHAAYQRNPLAKRGCHYVADFVIGDGFNLSCQNSAVEAVLNDFIEHPDNDLRTYEHQLVIDLLLDGEIIIRYFSSDDGQLAAVPQRPWELMWITTDPGFFRRKVSYHFQRYLSKGDDPTGTQETTWEDVDADVIQFVAINRSSYELRGRPELYPILPWLRAYKEWLEDRARQNHWRGVFAWWVKIKSTIPAVIAAKVAQYQRPPTSGSIIVTSENEEWTAVNNTVDANGAGEDGRQIKLMTAVGFGLPEYFLSDGQNANLASATRQQLPALTTFASFQRVLVEQVWRPMFRRVIQAAIDAGKLPEEIDVEDADGDPVFDADGQPRRIETLKAFEVSYAPLQDSNILNIAQAMEIALRNNLTSEEIASTEMGFDYDVVKKQRKKEAAEQRDAMANGEIPTPPGVTPPGMDGVLDDETADGEEDEEVDNAVLPRTA